jgi:ATP-dependent exoDNAse (exonuclease V) beta subunit
MYNCSPGTGKSFVIVNLIIQILYAQKQYRKHGSRRNVPRILVCAPSNAAIDELVIRLLRIRQSIQSRYTSKSMSKGMKAVGQCRHTERNGNCNAGCLYLVLP